MTEPSLVLLIPAFNEELRIEPVLRDYGRYFKEQYNGKFQLVVVLNGCTDDTIGVVRRVGAEYPAISALEFHEAIGKGGALIEGLKLAPLADLIGYVDADGATPPHAFHDLVKHMGMSGEPGREIPPGVRGGLMSETERRVDCAIGSRWLPDSVLHVEQSGQRRFASRGFHFIVQLLFQLGIRDTQCGAKVMRREAVEKIHSTLLIADMAFDINLLYSLHRAGYRILEVPTEWTDKIGTKVTLFRTSLTMFLSVFRIWLIYRPWLYKMLRIFSPLEAWIYKKLSAPKPLSLPSPTKPKENNSASKKS